MNNVTPIDELLNESNLEDGFLEITPTFSVSDAVAVFNQIFETATPTITVVGEVANYKISQNKWVFFDIKDDNASLGCFMSVFNLRVAVEDGMRVAIVARPQITKWGKFSLTVQSIRPVGEGSIKKSFELLREKLEKEGIFAAERKRALPELPTRIGVISSVGAAGYADFIKILDARFGGISVDVANVQVQGEAAPDQIMRALNFFNARENPPEVIAILRGGGSRDDLVAFDDEKLVRAIAASRVPTIVGVGHEIDTTLADLAADVRASTPSNAAEILVPDRREIVADVDARLQNLIMKTENKLKEIEAHVQSQGSYLLNQLNSATEKTENKLKYLSAALKQLNPRTVLNRGYSIVRNAAGEIARGNVKIGEVLTIENRENIIDARVEKITENH
jgi:exodeoxyribonuclease VII large subunit